MEHVTVLRYIKEVFNKEAVVSWVFVHHELYAQYKKKCVFGVVTVAPGFSRLLCNLQGQSSDGKAWRAVQGSSAL